MRCINKYPLLYIYLTDICMDRGCFFLRQKVELLLSVLFLLGLIAASRSIGKYVSSAQVENGKPVVVVDAGHGGA